jgi:ABC-2 type transport system ATP-binding protein
MGDVATTRQVATALTGVGAIEIDDERHVVHINAPDSGRSVLEIVRNLDRSDLPPERITLREPTLDDVFLELTGGHIQQEETEGGETSDDGDG